MTRQLRVGVIGCADHSLEDMVKPLMAAGARISAVADPVERRRNGAADLVQLTTGRRPLGFKAGGRLLARFDKLDAVVVASPAGVHHAHASRALERGLHVLVEQPLTISLATSLELVMLAEGNDRVLDVACDMRLCLAAHARAVRDGLLGELLHARAVWLRPAERGGALLDLGSPLVDVAVPFLNAAPSRVVAKGSAAHVHAMLIVDDGPSLELELWCGAPVTGEVRRLELAGTHGRLLVPLPGPAASRDERKPIHYREGGSSRLFDPLPPSSEGQRRVAERFVRACAGGGPRPGRAELLATPAVIDALAGSIALDGAQTRVPVA
jgi:predicted dehydrogenase